MSQAARNTYLESEIRTATPQRLRKLLIDGAWRFCMQASDALANGEMDNATSLMERAHLILSELLAGIKPGYDVSKSVTELYVFMIRELLAARKEHSLERLQGIITVLDIERETWRQVCEAVPHRLSGASNGTREILSRDAEQILSSQRKAPAAVTPNRSSFTMEV